MTAGKQVARVDEGGERVELNDKCSEGRTSVLFSSRLSRREASRLVRDGVVGLFRGKFCRRFTRSLLRHVAGGRGVGARPAAALVVRRAVVVLVVRRAIAVLVFVGAPFSGVVASRRRVVVAL